MRELIHADFYIGTYFLWFMNTRELDTGFPAWSSNANIECLHIFIHEIIWYTATYEYPHSKCAGELM